MSEFKREERYVVIKLKEIDEGDKQDLRKLLITNDIETVECVVVEHDWPNYEATWKSVQQVAEGTYDPDEITRLQSEVERLQGRCAELLGEVAIQNELMQEMVYTESTVNRKSIADSVASNGAAWLLRKQAETVVEFGEFCTKAFPDFLKDGVRIEAGKYAQRLRQQAAELEKL